MKALLDANGQMIRDPATLRESLLCAAGLCRLQFTTAETFAKGHEQYTLETIMGEVQAMKHEGLIETKQYYDRWATPTELEITVTERGHAFLREED